MKIARIITVLLLGTASGLSLPLTTTTLSSSLNPSTYGETVTFKAVVTPVPPNGETVTFKQGNTVLGTGTLSSGSATFAISTLTTGGTDNIKAFYSGDSNFAGSTSSVVAQVVDPAPTTTTLTSSLNPANVGQSVTFMASVTPAFGGTVTGNVTFYNGSARLGGESLSGGVASYTTANLPAGTDSITAVYKGDSSFATSTSNAVSQVAGSGTFIDSSITWDGVTRYYEVYVPTVLPANPPLLLMLHGTQSTASTGSDPTPVITLNWGWQNLAELKGFILVKPCLLYTSRCV